MKLIQKDYRNEEFSEKDVTGLMNMGVGGGNPNGTGGSATPPPAGGAATPPPDEGAATTPPAGAAATPPPAGATPPPAGAGAPPPTEEYETHDLEALGFQSIDEIRQMRDDYARAQKELNEAKAQPKFKSERAKNLYEFANRHEGMELEAARQYLELVNLDLTKEADHHLRFRAFSLKPEMKGYSQAEIEALFADEELRNFGDPNTEGGQTEIQKIRAKGATAQAKEQLSKLQEEYKKVPAQEAQRTPEELAAERAAYTDFVKKELTTFDGIALKLSATLEDGKKVEGALNFKLDAETQLPAVVNAIVDPQGWWENFLTRHGVLVEGQEQPNVSKFGEIVARLEHQEELLNQTYQQGRHDQIALHAKTHRNAGAGGESGTPGGESIQKSEKELELEGALKTIGLPTA